MAAREGHLPVCQLLLDAAEDKNPKDDKDVTPYSLALENGHQEVARFISEMVKYRGATANLSQARTNILRQNFMTGCFLYERIETQNLGKATCGCPAFDYID